MGLCTRIIMQGIPGPDAAADCHRVDHRFSRHTRVTIYLILYYDIDGYADRPSEVKSTCVFVQERGRL